MKKVIVRFSAMFEGEIELEVADNATEEDIDDELSECESSALFAAAQTDLAPQITAIIDPTIE